MSSLHAILDVTSQIEGILHQSITPNNRESIISEITILIEKRGRMMEALAPPFSEEEKYLGKKVVKLNEEIERKMESLFEALKQDIRKVNKQKESNRSYINPYGNIKSTDGMYLDSKH